MTLTGTVPSHSILEAVLEDSWVISGVRDIQNLLKVDIGMESPSNSEVKENIDRSLTWDTELSPSSLQASVLDGWVTLEGTVDAFWKKARAQDLVYRMRGVTGLTNKVAVVPTQTYEDEQLAREVINALDRNIIVTVDEINVTVEQGIVYLTGTVTSWAAKRAAYDASPGIRRASRKLSTRSWSANAAQQDEGLLDVFIVIKPIQRAENGTSNRGTFPFKKLVPLGIGAELIAT